MADKSKATSDVPEGTNPDGTRPGDGGQAEPTTDPATTDTAATIATATPEKIAPKRYAAVGQEADATLYGIVQADGTVRPTARGGKSEPRPGERGVVIVAKGDTITRAMVATLGGEG